MAGLWPAGWDRPAASRDGGPDGAAAAQSLILTLALPPDLQRAADTIRARDWPDAAARAPAHLALFRHLPGLAASMIEGDMRAIAAEAAPDFRLEAPVKWDGLWVASVRSAALDALWEMLAERWHGWLSAPDLGRPRLHVSLSRGRSAPLALPPGPWVAPGLLLWRYPPPGQQLVRPGEGRQCDRACWTPLVAARFRR